MEMPAMSRKLFLTIAALIALLVGFAALAAPYAVLGSKGIAGNPQAEIWTREVGVLLASIGVMAFLLRSVADSMELKAFLFGNFLVQTGLFPIELLAWKSGTITQLTGIVPNSVAHVLLAAGFAYFALRIKKNCQTTDLAASKISAQS
jgi:hypothetical protein